MRKAIILTMLFGLSVNLQGYIEHPLNERKSIDVVFSHDSHNRVAVKEGSVAKVFGDSNTFVINLDRTTGQVFISLLQKIEKAPKTLTVVTSSGSVQDLSIYSKDGGGEHVCIQEKMEECEEALIPNTLDFQTITVDLLNSILSEEVPIGYGRREVASQETLNLPKPLQTKALYTLEGAFEEITAYEISNRGKRSLTLETATLKSPQDSWVFLTSHTLAAKYGKTLCLVCKSKEMNRE